MQITKGSTNVSIELLAISNTTNDPESGIIFEDVTVNYRRDISAIVSATGVSLATITTAHTDWGFIESTVGSYRVDLPAAALATGADRVYVGVSAVGAWFYPVAIELIDAPATAAGQVTTQTAIGNVNVVSLASVSRSNGVTLTAYIGENTTFPPITPKDVDGSTLDTSAITLEVTIETTDGTDIVTIADGSLTKTTTTVQFTSTATANTSQAQKQWAIRRTDNDVVVAQGPYVVKYAAGA